MEKKTVVELAQQARVVQDKDNAQVLVLENGRRVEGIVGHGEFRITNYAEHQVYPARTDFSREASKAEYQPINRLWGSSEPSFKAELYQRYSIVLSTLILMILAVPLSKVSPNSSRFARLAVAVAIYILYLNLVIVSCSWIKKGEPFGIASIMCVHAFAILVTMLVYQPSFFLGVSKWRN